MTLKNLHFSFDDADGARRAIRALESVEVRRLDIRVMSGEPFIEVDDPLAAAHPSHIGLYSVVGGLIGSLAGFLLVYLTSRSYPLVTSAMPLVPPMTTGIIVYETTAVGAILFTLGRMLWEAGLPDFKSLREDYVPAMDEGGLILSVPAGEDEQLSRVRSIVAEMGGRELEVSTLGAPVSDRQDF